MIRTPTPQDAEALAHICRTALGPRANAEQVGRQIAAMAGSPFYYLAVWADDADGRVLGFLQAQRYDLVYGESGWNAMALAVATEAQGRGIGRQLLAALEQHAAAQGAAFIRLNSNVVRTGAHGFYQHLGYHEDKTQKRFSKRLVPARG